MLLAIESRDCWGEDPRLIELSLTMGDSTHILNLTHEEALDVARELLIAMDVDDFPPGPTAG